MPAAKTANTQVEILQSILQDITKAKMTPDADLPFLVGLETTILSYLRRPIEQMTGQLPGYGGPSAQGGGGSPAAGPPPPGGMPPGGPPGMPPGAAMGLPPSPMAARLAGAGGPPAGAGGPGPGAPNPDEIRRMLSGS